MFGAIKYAFANLANFNGRDARQTFWFCVLFIFLLRFFAGMLISVPMMGKIARAAFDAAKSGPHPDEAAIQATMTTLVTENLSQMVWMSMAIGVVTMLLLCASLVRRLHDSDLSGWLVLVPGALYAIVIASMPRQIDVVIEMMRTMKPGTPPNMAAVMQAQGTIAFLAWVPVALIIWFGVRKSSDGPNRHGEAPVSF